MDCFERKTAHAFTLEFKTKPISVNALYRTIPGAKFSRAIMSAEYRTFKKQAGEELESQKPPHIPGPFGCKISIAKGCRHDIDNVAKAWLDLLADHGVTDDDRHCEKLEISRSIFATTQIQIFSTRMSDENRPAVD